MKILRFISDIYKIYIYTPCTLQEYNIIIFFFVYLRYFKFVLISCDIQVVSSTLWGIRMVILIKAELWPQVNSIKQSSVKTGIANALGKKLYFTIIILKWFKLFAGCFVLLIEKY